MSSRLPIMLALGLTSTGPAVAYAQPDGDALARRFLAHIDSIPPVAGIFTIETRFDQERMESIREERREWFEAQGKKVKHGPEAPDCRMEWAWDGVREAAETLSGSNVFRQFYHTPEATLEGMLEDNYNLGESDRPGDLRPASFYLIASGKPWSEFLEGCRFSTAAPPADAPAGAALLVARSRRHEARLVVDEGNGVLHGHEIAYDGNPAVELVIDRLEPSADGRIFPSRARITHYLQGKPYSFSTLTADRIVFDPSGVAGMMKMTLAAGTSVHDRVLERHTRLDRPTDAEDVIVRSLTSSFPDGSTPAVSNPRGATSNPIPLRPPQAVVELPSPGSSRRWPAWIIGINIAVLAAVGAWLFLKGGRKWDREHPGNS